ncbi:transposase [Niallia sp. NCCP-28]|uniref:RNA-guided endonuclease InsQ/TnpB family protein n=1 Tax=Niallia sp. NCCP-28 TaxID=2934712 RepID=UPI0020890D13|nr:transposase [Niallia sp. NCCP-28]GKU84752.1 transposase [Niallia sp. NCCP-28]
MIVTRVEKHIIKPNHTHYKMLDEFCFKSKNLYNFANYQIRQRFINNGKYIGYKDLDKLLKQEELNYDYKQMPLVQSSQQLLRLLDKNWKSFFNSVKDHKKNPNRYTGRPKLPKYLSKNGRQIVILTNQNCKIKGDTIKFPKSFNGFYLNTKIEKELQQVRVLPRNKYIVVEVVYKTQVKENKINNGKYLSIDIGLDNFATIVNNVGQIPVVINGKGLKSINKLYNKDVSHYREIAKRMNKLDWTDKMNRLTIKRNNIISNFIHQASNWTIKHALSLSCNIVVVGNNKDWKRESKMSKKVNQSFVGIPHQMYIQQLQYKAENVGLSVIITEEPYTSKCSFLDLEDICKHDTYKGKRVKRGMFKSAEGELINADVNGAYNIMRKVFSDAFANGVSGVGLHPVRVNVI